MPPTNTNTTPPSLAAKHQARIAEILASTTANPALRIQLLRIEADECTHDRILVWLDIMIEYHEFSARMDHHHHQTRARPAIVTATSTAAAVAAAATVSGIPPNAVVQVVLTLEEMKRVHELRTRKMIKEHDDVGVARDLAEGYIIAAARGRRGGEEQRGGWEERPA